MTAPDPAPAAVALRPLEARTVLITGASGGLGRELSAACARAGATVVLLGRRVAALEAQYDRLLADGAREPAIYPLDLVGATPDDYAQLADAIARECGRLDAVLHAAVHFDGLAALPRLAPEAWARALHVGLTAPWWLTQACLPLLTCSDGGAIGFTLDAPARVAHAHWGAYSVAKAGLARLVDVLGEELEASGVRVLGVVPPAMAGGVHHKAYIAEDPATLAAPRDVAEAFVHALADRTARGILELG
jgi:NAD(P)-dependent dehydrogenase (short-subunit alcohol dehydrogenase family)